MTDALLALLGFGLFSLWLGVQMILNRRLHCWIASGAGRGPLRLRPLQVGQNCLLTLGQLRRLLQQIRQLLHLAVVMLVAYVVLPFPLDRLPATHDLAVRWQNQLRGLLVQSGALLRDILPDLLVIGLIVVTTSAVLRGIHAWFAAMEQGRVRLDWFYPEWARPTARLASLAVLVMAAVMAYPFVPGSNSRVFQNTSIFVGALALLGSSGVASNVVSGLMLTYTRAFQVGDRISLDGRVGTVLSCNLLVTRLRTIRNEVVSLPNAAVLNAAVVNYSLIRRERDRPVLLSVTVHVDLEVPWRRVQQCLIEAATNTAGVSRDEPTEVQQVALERSCLSYELTVGVAEVSAYSQTQSQLLASIQDVFLERGIALITPEAVAVRPDRR
ncbi:mechanosensitive ion channel family protein [Vulcanococcus sp.]|uniref:mechanosensitive ion channel family protein n=1 Tax=Vulcanococcus sp. TaxID=2856995 RepID=UPI003F6A024E